MSREWVPTDEEEQLDIWRAAAEKFLEAWAASFVVGAPIASLGQIKGGRDHLVIIDEVKAFEAEAYQDWLSQQR